MALTLLLIFYRSFAAELVLINCSLQVSPSIAVIDGAVAYGFREWQLISIGDGAVGCGDEVSFINMLARNPSEFLSGGILLAPSSVRI